MLADDDFDDRCRRLYRSLRDGSVNREASFDLSADILLDVPADEEAAKVAAVAIDEDADPALLAAAVRALLADRFEPTFADEPGWFAALEDALEIVKADLRASGLPDTVRLYTREGSRNVGVDAWAANSTSPRSGHRINAAVSQSKGLRGCSTTRPATLRVLDRPARPDADPES